MPDRNRTDRLGLPPRPSLATPRESLNKAASVLKWRRWEVQKEHGEEGNQLRYVSMFYNDLLAGKSWKILEIGVSAGGSAMMFGLGSSTSTYVGLDINLKNVQTCPEGYPKNVTLLEGDVKDPKIVERLAALGPFDLIIDDGSHYMEDQVAALKGLFPLLAPGGYFVIEDINLLRSRGYTNNRGIEQVREGATILKFLADTAFDNILPAKPEDWFFGLSSIEFKRLASPAASLVVLRKGSDASSS